MSVLLFAECQNRLRQREDEYGTAGVTLRSMNWIDALQWPAMIVTVVAAWLMASQRKFKRNWAFWLFLLSNVLWVIWGWHDHAYALIFLQLCLAFLNTRGALKNRSS